MRRDRDRVVAVMVRPTGVDEVAEVLRQASISGTAVRVTGGGTHSGYGTPAPTGITLDMTAMSRVLAWDPDDLTVTVEAGMGVSELETLLGSKSQTAVLPEHPGAATVGGVVSAGVSSLRRGRLLGLRERVLEVTLVTGDGRVVRAGGRVVKNVTGYDLPRLTVGAFGSLGVVVSVCLKAWPTPAASATVTLSDPERPLPVTRPLAVLDDAGRRRVFLWGTAAEVRAAVSRLAGESEDGLHWPADPRGAYVWSLRVPSSLTREAVDVLPAGWRHLALLGVGEVRAASDSARGAEEVRSWAEARGGRLVAVDRPDPGFEPWGAPPPGLELQRRLIAGFDPVRVINPGRLPGGL